jgi:argininosuccinate synthase
MLQTAMDEAAKCVTGTARLKLYKGNVHVVGRKSPNSLYDETWPPSRRPVYDQKDADTASSASTPCACACAPAHGKG